MTTNVRMTDVQYVESTLGEMLPVLRSPSHQLAIFQHQDDMQLVSEATKQAIFEARTIYMDAVSAYATGRVTTEHITDVAVAGGLSVEGQAQIAQLEDDFGHVIRSIAAGGAAKVANVAAGVPIRRR